MFRYVIAIVLVLLSFGATDTASAQVNNPTSLTFDSPDHNTVDGQNRNILVGYRVEFIQDGATTATQTVDIARAAVLAVSGNTYRIPFNALPSYPFGVVYRARVTAVGLNENSTPTLSAQTFTKPVPAPAAVTNVQFVSQ